MNFVRFSAGLARRGRSRAVARTAAARRFAVFSVALAAVLAGVALTTGPASASASVPQFTHGTCLDANSGQVYDGGQIFQWECNASDLYQEWSAGLVEETAYGPVYQLQNVGALDVNNAADCLDADAGQVYDGGEIIQMGCDTSDPYQLWLITNTAPADGGGAWSYQNYGALLQQGAADCLDAHAGQAYDTGAIIQWGCNTSDAYQLWQSAIGPNGQVLANIGTAFATGGGV